MGLRDAPLDLLAMKGAIKTFLDMADLGVFVVAPVVAPSFRRQEYRRAFGVVERFVAAGLSAADDDKFLIHFKTFLLCWCGVVVSLRSFSRACFLVRLFAPALAPNALSAPRSTGLASRGYKPRAVRRGLSRRRLGQTKDFAMFRLFSFAARESLPAPWSFLRGTPSRAKVGAMLLLASCGLPACVAPAVSL